MIISPSYYRLLLKNKGCFRILCCYLPSSALWLISPPDARFPRGGGEPPRRKRLWGLHLSRCSRRRLALPLQSTLNSFILKTTIFTKRAKIQNKQPFRIHFLVVYFYSQLIKPLCLKQKSKMGSIVLFKLNKINFM